jgi:hypothetical protein
LLNIFMCSAATQLLQLYLFGALSNPGKSKHNE